MIEADVFRALADPTRRTLFERLSSREMSAAQLKRHLSISQPAVSQHLTVLRRAGLVRERRDGRAFYYRADPGGLEPLVGWLERYRTFWPERLEKLANVLKDMNE
jgi:DNA-binding transcriptional ArsR family regulator